MFCKYILDRTLKSQGVNNASNIMVFLTEKGSVNDCNEELDMANRVNETKKVAEALSRRSDGID